MQYFVTGATGFIGKRLVKTLLERRGSTVYFPVYVKGGGLSMGDIHFSQGDGEITFCGAIEMAGYLDLRVRLEGAIGHRSSAASVRPRGCRSGSSRARSGP